MLAGDAAHRAASCCVRRRDAGDAYASAVIVPEARGARVIDDSDAEVVLVADHDARLDPAPGTVPLRVPALPAADLCEPYGLEPGGMVMVRPDGHVAWRSVRPPADPEAAVIAAAAATAT